jgi:hypothetical protein
MARYTLEVQLNTSQYFLMLADDVAEAFDVAEFRFHIAKSSIDSRPGLRYFVSNSIDAPNHKEAYIQFMERLLRVTDSMAYYYSQPVSVENWNLLITKEGDARAYFSGHKLRAATSMSDYDALNPDLSKVVEVALTNIGFYNVAWLYNNISKIDSVDFDPASHQLALSQLVEALAEKEQVEACRTCGRTAHIRTSRRDIEAMLGTDLYNKLYGGGNPLRNRLAHGSLTDGSFLENKDVEDIILKINIRIQEKHGIKNKVSPSMIDRIRATNVWHGTAMPIEHNNRSLEECLAAFYAENLDSLESLPKDW